ncbi:hypothetical protein [Spongiibacter sp. UBA1325]|uniref:hypothetical protein n=1 Tax=Spongiibacter sp. UBA1325 TaxID=1947543 RepID=UPI00257C95FD|nr:hypothetical protein [Spongiibacter sp. UBA1325]|tara:strand:- start:1316 stop:1795 length:480 start_codon:yes stop_codon:yes gene_type:complete
MTKRNWKRQRGQSIRHAMELCIRYARDIHNLSVERIAELMGLESHYTLYKWLETGRMPAVMIRPFEHACQCDFLSIYIAHSANKLALDMPTGRRAEHKELNELSVYTHTVIGQLIAFYHGKSEQQDVITALTTLIEDLAHQRGNVTKDQQPELSLEAAE